MGSTTCPMICCRKQRTSLTFRSTTRRLRCATSSPKTEPRSRWFAPGQHRSSAARLFSGRLRDHRIGPRRHAAPYPAPPRIFHNIISDLPKRAGLRLPPRYRAAAPPKQGAACKMLIGRPQKWILTKRVRDPRTRSSAGPVSRSRKRSEAIGRQSHGSPPARQATAAHFRYCPRLRLLQRKLKDALPRHAGRRAGVRPARIHAASPFIAAGIAKSLSDALPSCHNVRSIWQERYCHKRTSSYGRFQVDWPQLPHGVGHVASRSGSRRSPCPRIKWRNTHGADHWTWHDRTLSGGGAVRE